MKICPVGAELFHGEGRTDGQTDMARLIVAFRNSANAPKSVIAYIVYINGHWIFGETL